MMFTSTIATFAFLDHSRFATADLSEPDRFYYHYLEKWGGDCAASADPSKPQQSPVDLLLASHSPSIAEHSIDFTTLDRYENSLYQYIQKTDTGNLIMRMEPNEENTTSFVYDHIKYELDHIHSHWGSSEHLVNGKGTDGNFHLVFLGDPVQKPDSMWSPIGQPGAVIEIMIKFVSEVGPGVLTDFPRCPIVPEDERHLVGAGCPMHKPEDAHNHHHHEQHLQSHQARLHHHHEQHHKHHHEHHLQDHAIRVKKNLLQHLGWTDHDFGTTINYTGSLTVPPCGGPIKWFVQTEPVFVHDPLGDWVGCADWASLHKHEEGTPSGNYRPSQPIKSWTTFKKVSMSWNVWNLSSEEDSSCETDMCEQYDSYTHSRQKTVI